MAYELLEIICDAALPMVVSDPDKIDEVRCYVAAGLVLADVPPPVRAVGASLVYPPALVRAVTPAGRKAVSDLHSKGTRQSRR